MFTGQQNLLQYDLNLVFMLMAFSFCCSDTKDGSSSHSYLIKALLPPTQNKAQLSVSIEWFSDTRPARHFQRVRLLTLSQVLYREVVALEENKPRRKRIVLQRIIY